MSRTRVCDVHDLVDKPKSKSIGVDHCQLHPRCLKVQIQFFPIISLQHEAGKVQSAYLRDLVGVINRENAQIGVLVSLDHSTQEMCTEGVATGSYEKGYGGHPRIQLITIEEILARKK